MKIYTILFFNLFILKTLFAFDDKEFNEVGVPDEVFSGTYVALGVGGDFLNTKYEISDTPVVANLKKKNSINTNTQSVYGVLGFGGIFSRKIYLGFETELCIRRGSSGKESENVRVTSHGTYGFNFKLRGGYAFKQQGIMLYSIIGADRSINRISIKENNRYLSDVSYGSHNPMIGIGIEKKLRNNWSIRTEFSYTIGIWDDTDKSFTLSNNSNLAFKAKADKKAIKVFISKYF